MSERVLFNVTDAARYLGLSRSGLYRAFAGELSSAPRLSSLRIAGRRMVERSAMDEWVAELKSEQAE